jgi:hypothetical protein
MLGLFVAFGLFYGVPNAIADRHGWRVRLHFDFEPRVPFVEEAVLGYASIYGVFGLVPFVLRQRRELDQLGKALLLIMAVASPLFLVLPGQAAFPVSGDPGVWAHLVEGVRWMAGNNNYFPSLHVGLSNACLLVMAGRAPRLARFLLLAWGVCIAASTVLLHQHYLIDVAGGYALAALGRFVAERETRGFPGGAVALFFPARGPSRGDVEFGDGGHKHGGGGKTVGQDDR